MYSFLIHSKIQLLLRKMFKLRKCAPKRELIRSGKEDMQSKRFKQIRCIVVCSMFWIVGLIPIGARVHAEMNQTYINEQYVTYVEEICEEYNICPELIIAIIESESDGRAGVISKSGAVGLMQVVPKWHTDRMERLGVTNIYDPYSNILVGVDYISELANKYYEVPTVLMCYNEGEYGTAIERAERGEFSEYAKKIMRRAEKLQEANE